MGIRLVVLGVGTFNRDTNLARSTLTGLDRAVEGTASKFNQIGATISRMGQLWTTTITLPIVLTTGALIASGIQFEDAFAGVSKTVEGVSDNFGTLTKDGEALRKQFRGLALEIPISVNELARIGEMGGALGIGKDALLDFTKTVALLSVTTDMTSESAADFVARFGNIMGVAAKDMGAFAKQAGSTVVELGNKFAATEPEIAALSLRIAGAARASGVSTPDILGLAAAVASLGIQSELGGSALSRVFLELKRTADDFTATGGEATDQIKLFAKAFGGTVQEFVAMQKSDPTTTMLRVIDGLNKMQEAGTLSSDALTTMNFDTIRLQDVLNRLGPNIGFVTDALGKSNAEWKTQTALNIEAQKRFNTTKSQLILLKNAFVDLGITIFDLYSGPIKALIKSIKSGILVINALNESSLRWVIKIAMIVAAIGPLLIVLGSLIQLFGTLKGFATIGAIALGGLSTPLIIITGLIAAFGLAWSKNFLGIKDTLPKVAKEVKNTGKWLGKAFDFGKDRPGGNFLTGLAASFRALTYVYKDNKTTFFSNVLEAFGLGEELSQSLGMAIKNVLAPALLGLSFVLNTAGTLFRVVYGYAVMLFNSFTKFPAIVDNLKMAFAALSAGDWSAIFDFLKLAWQGVIEWFNGPGKLYLELAFRSIMDILRYALLTAIPVIEKVLVELGIPFVKWVIKVAPDVIDALGDLIEDILKWVGKQVKPVADKLLEWADKFIDWVIDMAPGLLDELEGLITDVLGWIGDKLVDLDEKLLLWGAAFIDWLGPVIEDIVPKLAELAGKILGWLLVFVYIDLPPMLAKLVAKFISWVAKAAVDILPELWTFLKSFNKFITETLIPGAWDAAKSFGKGFIDGIKQGITDNWDSVLRFITEKVRSIPGVGDKIGDILGLPTIYKGPFGNTNFSPGGSNSNISPTAGYNIPQNTYKGGTISNSNVAQLSNVLSKISVAPSSTANTNYVNRSFAPNISTVPVANPNDMYEAIGKMYRMSTLAVG